MPVISAILAPRFTPLPCAIFEASLSGGPLRPPPYPPPLAGEGREGPGCRLRHVSHQTAARQGGAWDPARSVIAVPWTAIGATLRPPPFAGSVPKGLGVAGSSAATTPLWDST